MKLLRIKLEMIADKQESQIVRKRSCKLTARLECDPVRGFATMIWLLLTGFLVLRFDLSDSFVPLACTIRLLVVVECPAPPRLRTNEEGIMDNKRLFETPFLCSYSVIFLFF